MIIEKHHRGFSCSANSEERKEREEKVKVNFILEQAMKSQRGSRGLVLPFL
jgi:hypothetical protein